MKRSWRLFTKPRSGSRPRGRLGTLAVAVLTGTAVFAAIPAAQSGIGLLAPATNDASVPVSTVPLHPVTTPKMKAFDASAVWPAAGSATAQLAAAGTRVAAAGLPVSVARTTHRNSPARVRVSVSTHSAAVAAGVDGVVASVGRADGTDSSGDVTVAVNYRKFGDAYGGGYGSRLRLEELPSCALTTPEQADCRTATPIPSSNDSTTSTVTADVTLPATGAAVIAATSAPSGGGGDFTATPLKPSGQWGAGGASGAFTYTYPIQVPPVPGDLTPDVDLGYNSQDVDGATSATNNQPSFVGDGWSYAPGFVERDQPECATVATVTADQTGDECWSGDPEVTMTLDGSTTVLVDDPSTGWHTKNDADSRVQLATGGTNGDQDGGEYWIVTTTDGTRYYFGLNELPGFASGDKATNSVATVPTYATASGQPCFNSTFSASECEIAYRWNLDYVVDTHGDAMAYYYTPETNSYGADDGTKTLSYTRGSYLSEIDYGFRDGSAYSTTTSPAAKVLLTVNGRCDTAATGCATSTLSSSTAANWPDVPFDENCSSSCTANTVWSPSFWTEYELTSIQTEALTSSGYQNMDGYALQYAFPATGDTSSPALWLESIQHTGEDASSSSGYVTMPPTTFTGSALSNRVILTDGFDPLTRQRLTKITTETGEIVTVAYSGPGCANGPPASSAGDTMLCYSEFWTPSGATSPMQDWFNKYVVTSVTEQDTTGGSPPIQTSYNYVGSPAWRFEDNPNLKAADRTWDQWRGFPTVQTTVGTSPDPQTMTQDSYFQGMDGDPNGSGGTTSATVSDSRGETVTDSDWLAGSVRESIMYDGTGSGSGGPVLSDEITDPWSMQTGSQARSGLANLLSEQTGIADTRTYVPLASGGTRESEVSYAHDSNGRVTATSTQPDVSTSVGGTCVNTTYATNTSAWILDPVASVTELSVPCTTAPTYPTNLIEETLNYYDGSTTNGAAPSVGDKTMVEKVTSVDSSGTITGDVTGAETVDEYGRVLTSTDGNGNKSTTAYTPATGQLPTSQTLTDALGHVTTSDFQPGTELATENIDAGGFTSTQTYDALGRLTAAWKPGEPTGSPANLEFTYAESNTQLSVVTTKTLGPGGVYRTSEDLYDSLLRERETQDQTSDGRLITLHYFDSVGNEVKTTDPFFNDNPVDTCDDPSDSCLVSVTDGNVPSETGYTFDGAGRQTAEISYQDGTETWETDTSYPGTDETVATPPAGGTPTETISDAQGRTTELEQYNATTPTGTPSITQYAYDPAGEVTSLTSPGGNTSTFTYNLLGNKTSQTDPNGGMQTMTYDADGNILSTTDGRGKTLSFTYDADDRKTAEYDTTGGAAESSSDEVASWTYDTKKTGYLTSSTSFQNGAAFVDSVTGYNGFAEPTGDQVKVPSTTATGALAGTYTRTFTYDSETGLQTGETDQAAGGLPQETIDYGTDGFGRQTGLTGTLTGANGTTNVTYVNSLTYTELDQPSQYTFGNPNGSFAQLTLGYDPQTQAVKSAVTTVTGSTTPIDDTNYTYNNMQDVTQVSDQQDETGTQHTDDQCYTYDNLDRLSSAWTTTAGSCGTQPTSSNASSLLGNYEPYWQSWTYDGDGNRSSETDHDPTGNTAKDNTTAYTYPAAQSASDQPNTLTSTTTTTGGTTTGTSTFTYDAAGNTTQMNTPAGNQSLNWNDQDQLATDTTGTGTSSYTYDATGNLLMQQDPSGTTLFLPDEQLVNNGGVVTGTRYYSLNGTQVALRAGAGDVSCLIPNRQGSDVLQIDATSLAATRESYTPFGTLRTAAPTAWAGDQGYVGGTNDSNTGLENLGAREYDAGTGRFISLDPVLETTDPQQLNGYDYAGNNPTSDEDPSGLLMIDGGGCIGSVQYCAHHGDSNGARSGSGAKKSSGSGSSGGSGGFCFSSTSAFQCVAGMKWPRIVRAAPKPKPKPVQRPHEAQRNGCSQTPDATHSACPQPSVAQDIHKHWKGISQIVGAVGFAACFFLTVGACAIVGVAVVGTQYALRGIGTHQWGGANLTSLETNLATVAFAYAGGKVVEAAVQGVRLLRGAPQLAQITPDGLRSSLSGIVAGLFTKEDSKAGSILANPIDRNWGNRFRHAVKPPVNVAQSVFNLGGSYLPGTAGTCVNQCSYGPYWP